MIGDSRILGADTKAVIRGRVAVVNGRGGEKAF